jgi:hypothetical protein
VKDAVLEPLILDLVEWIAARERTYEEAIEPWRTSCPRLPVWEEANSRGLIFISRERSVVKPTSLGLLMLQLRREEIRRFALGIAASNS